MVEKETVAKEKIKYGGLGDLKKSYTYAYSWLKNSGFSIVEDQYSEKVSGNEKEIEIEWTASKKLTDYFKTTMKIKWRILGMKDVEVEIDGKKKSMNKFVELGIEVKGDIEKDYNSQWEGSPFNKFLRDLYNKYIIPERTEQKEEQIKSAVQGFVDEMKAFLELTGKR